MKNYKNITYLSTGNTIQKNVYRAITKLNIFEILTGYNPILVGTIPIEIDTPGSDLDIICEVHNFAKFKELLSKHFGELENYRLKKIWKW